MSKQTQFIVLDVNHPQHPMHPVDPDNYIVLRQRYGDGQPTKSKPENFVCVDLVASDHTLILNRHISDIPYGVDLLICTDKQGGAYTFLGEWRNGVCRNPNTLCHDLRKDAPPRKEKTRTELTFSLTHGSSALMSVGRYEVVTLIEKSFQDGDDLILCYNFTPEGDKTHITLYRGRWNDGC